MNSPSDKGFEWMAAFLFAIPFSYAFQVCFQNYIVGVFPYFLLLPLILRIGYDLTKKSSINSWRRHLFCNRGCFAIIVFDSHNNLIFSRGGSVAFIAKPRHLQF